MVFRGDGAQEQNKSAVQSSTQKRKNATDQGLETSQNKGPKLVHIEHSVVREQTTYATFASRSDRLI